ncbi:hypothetical protein DFQ26_006281 [Actinomortierella ambigua]|nr:hypothetical protein DFQ26_006281 [Actinomortierella ambigua]
MTEVESKAFFASKQEIEKSLDSLNADTLSVALKRLRRQLNLRPNASDHTESAQATKALAPIYNYVEESPECTQLFKIWEWQQQHAVTKIEILILEVLAKLIHQCNTALHRNFSIKITRHIFQHQMTVLYRHLSSGRQSAIQATLRLLTAMNYVHHTTTKEIKEGFNFALKALPKFLNQRRKEGDEAAANKPDHSVKKDILEIKDLISPIFQGLLADTPQLVKQLLTVMLNHVILDNDLPRTVKIAFFSNKILENIARLYTRTEQEASNEAPVAQAAHDFLIAICTNPGVGVCFQDASWYSPSTLGSQASTDKTTGKPIKMFNKTLSRFLLFLRPTEHLLQQQLVVAILTACPELVRSYWAASSIHLDPRLSAKWLANVTLLHKVVEIPVPNLYVSHTGLFASHPPPVSTIMESVLPSIANRNHLSKGLQHSSLLVRYFTIVALAACFQKMEQVLAVMNSAVQALAQGNEELLNQSTDAVQVDDGMPANTTSTEPPAQQWANAIPLLLAELRRRVPDIKLIISIHSSVQSLVTDPTDQEQNSRLDLFNNGILRLIKYYQRFLPQAVNEAKFDTGKLIPTDFVAVQPGTLIHLLELLLELSDFRWSNKSSDGTSTHLAKLLTLYLTTSHKHIKSLARRLVSKLLGESILFQHNPVEATLWIDAIPPITADGSSATLAPLQVHLLQFLDDCVARCLRTPYKYVDQSSRLLKQLQDKASSEQAAKAADDLALSLEFSPHQSFSQHFSPLLMTFVEQFQFVAVKPESQATADSVGCFLGRLLPLLALNVNRTPALAAECAEQAQACITDAVQRVRAMDMQQQRSQLKTIGAAEYLAFAMESLQGCCSSAAAVQSGSRALLSSSHPKRVKGATPPTSVEELASTSVEQLMGSIKEAVNSLGQSTGSMDALVDYIRTRLPFAGGSFLDYPAVADFVGRAGEPTSSLSSSDQENASSSSPVDKLLRAMPFAVLMANVLDPSKLALPRVVYYLREAIQTAAIDDPSSLVQVALLIVHKIAAWVPHKPSVEAVKTLFGLLSVVLEAAREHESVYSELKVRVIGHFVFETLYLFDDSSSSSAAAHWSGLDTLDTCVADFIMSAVSLKSNVKMSNSGGDLVLIKPFVRKTTERVMKELENTKPGSKQTELSSKTVQLFSKLAKACHPEEVTAILQKMLVLQHRQGSAVVNSAFNDLLSIVLQQLTDQSDSASMVPTKSIASLLDLWRYQPSAELDAIVKDVVCGRLAPNALARTIGPLDLSEKGVFDKANGKWQLKAPDSLNLGLVNFILDNLNATRAVILAALITALPEFRQGLVQWFKSKQQSQSKKKSAFSLSHDLITVLHAYASFLSHNKGHGKYVWSRAASDEDKSALTDMASFWVPKLIERVKAENESSEMTVRAAECASMMFALSSVDTSNESAAVHATWSLIESFTRTGLDVVTMHEAVMEMTKRDPVEDSMDVDGDEREKEDMVRQERLSRWFERTAGQLINVLDRHGDCEWLEPVCAKLQGLLERHVVERKLSIDQKLIFELVSFTIEKALDNLELVRFSTCLLDKYYMETTQTSPAPNILQTLFKHRQFVSLTLPTSPSAKYTRPENHSIRLAIIHLIYTLTYVEPAACCKSGFLPTLMACYTASTSKADELLLAVLRIHETQTSGSISHRAPLWGSGNDNAKLASTLFGQALITESLALLDPLVMLNSAINLSLDRPLETRAKVEVSASDFAEPGAECERVPMYDPCFLLPLFATYMSYGNQLDCRRFMEVNGLGFIVATLSSNDEGMRRAAYFLLDEFYTILSNVQLREKNQMMLVLDSLKNSVVEREDGQAPPRIPSVLTLFVTHAIVSVLRPDHFMYPHVNKFCLQRPTMDLEDIPMFYSLFNSSSDHFRKERVWILRLLSGALKSYDDYKLYRRRHVMELLTGFANSPVSDPLSRRIVLEILFHAAAIPRVALTLITQHGWLSWLHSWAVLTPLAMENEFSMVAPRLLLRGLRACPQESIKWMHGLWRQQMTGLATTLLRQLANVQVSSTNVGWALMVLEAILQLYYYASLQSSSTSSSSSSSSLVWPVWTKDQQQLLVSVLVSIEQVLTITPDQCPVSVPELPAWRAPPSRDDPLEQLYYVDPVPVRTHSRVIRLALELVRPSQPLSFSSSACLQFIMTRALCYNIDEALEWVK